MKTMKIEKDTVDMEGMTIPKDTTLYIVKDYTAPPSPMDGKVYNFKVVKVDNGTGHIELMPETCIRTEINGA